MAQTLERMAYSVKEVQEKIVPSRRQKTIDRYEGIIRLHIKPTLAHIELSKLSPVHVQELESKLQQNGMKPRGVEGVHNVLSGAMKHALRLELIGRNPVPLVSPPTIPKIEAYTPEVREVLDLLALAESEEHPLWVCIHLIAYTGMRLGEALALEWKHVDLDRQRVLVAQRWSLPRPAFCCNVPKRRTVSVSSTWTTDSGNSERSQGKSANPGR